ncbi:MAG: TonB-dependent receptor [Phenylobacterium sp.]|nr:TonB-dependent receptor [Phenylobacterium sp.]
MTQGASRLVLLMTSAALSAMATAAPAQTAGNAAGPRLEEIVVTARRAAENLQEVPISVTALSGQALERKSVTTVGELATFTPNARIRAHPSDPTTIVLSFRGQVQNDVLPTLDPSVGVYVDGVYWARAFGANASLIDIERVEVLKGPQGTLFGRNTTGGALNMKTNDPNFEAFSGNVSGRVGNHDLREGSGVVNMPLNDKVALRLAADYTDFGGYGHELVTGADLNDYKSWMLRAKLLFKPTDNTRLLLSAEQYQFHGAGASPKLIFFAPGSAATFEVAAESKGTDSLSKYLYNGQGSPYDVADGFKPYDRVNTGTYSATGSVDSSVGTINAIVGYRRYKTRRNEDLDGTPYKILTPDQMSEGHQFSQELQLTGHAMSNKLDYAAGVFHFDENIPEDVEASYALQAINPGAPAVSEGSIRNRSIAAYTQENFHFTDQFSVTAGVRYSVDKRELRSRNKIGPTFACNVPVGLRTSPTVCESDQKHTWHGWSYTLSGNYQPTQDTLIYVKTSKGFRSGGFQLRGGATVTDFSPFDPETVTDYEAGLKSEFLDHRVRFNTAAFYSDYQNIQRTGIVPRVGGGLSTIVTNAARGVVKGLEAEVTALPVERLELSGSIGITRPHYKRFVDASGDRSNEQFESVAKFTAAASAQYTVPVSLGDLQLQADYAWTGPMVWGKNLAPPASVSKGYSLVNARAALKLAKPNVELAIFAKNVFDTRYKYFALDLFGPGLGVIVGYYGAPREVGVQATYNF